MACEPKKIVIEPWGTDPWSVVLQWLEFLACPATLTLFAGEMQIYSEIKHHVDCLPGSAKVGVLFCNQRICELVQKYI